MRGVNVDETTNLDSGVGGISLAEASRIADERERKPEDNQQDDYQEDDSSDHEDQQDEPEHEQNPDDDDIEDVEYEGKKYQLPKNLKEALLRRSDYTQKTQAIAEQRRAIEQHAQSVLQERNYYANHVSQIVEQLGSSIQQLPSDQQLAELAQTDPGAYIKARADRDLKVAQYQQAYQVQQQITQQQQADEQRHFSETLTHERESLLTKLPEWKNEKIAARERESIVGYLSAEGYGGEELSNLTDHRAILVARKAMLYDQYVLGKGKQQAQQQSAPNQKQQTKPRVLPAGNQRQGAAPKAPKEMVQKFKSSGSMKDALAILNSIT